MGKISNFLVLFVAFQGADCVKFCVEASRLVCEYIYTDQKPSKLIDKTCVSTNVNYLQIGFNYHITTPVREYFHESKPYINMYMTLKGSLFLKNGSTEPLAKYTYRLYDYDTVGPFAVDLKSRTCYIIVDQLLSGPIMKSNDYIPLNVIIGRKDIEAFFETKIDYIMFKDLNVDPYRRYLFVLIEGYSYKAGDDVRSIIVRSDLSGKNLQKLIIDKPYTMNLDVGEMKLYVLTGVEGRINVYSYNGTLSRQLTPPCFPSDFFVLDNTIYMIPANETCGSHVKHGLNNVYEMPFNETSSILEISQTYQLSDMSYIDPGDRLEVIDARSIRRKESGKYVCDRNDCPQLCEVTSAGDKCTCYKNSSLSMYGDECYKCGVSDLTSVEHVPTIVNGTVSHTGDFPWHAILYNSSLQQICGGTLISTRLVLTAAHCVTSPVESCDNCKYLEKRPDEVTVALGKVKRSWMTHERLEERRNVTKIIIHERFWGASQSYENDIALLVLESETSSEAIPACLDYNLNQLPPHDSLDGYVCGFGYTEECAKTKCTEVSEVLRHAKTKAIYLDDCLQRIRELDNTTDHHTLTPDKFCIGSGSESTTQSLDSGGGFTLAPRGLHFVTGVVSGKVVRRTKKCGFKYAFGGITNVSMHMDWLKQKIIENTL